QVRFRQLAQMEGGQLRSSQAPATQHGITLEGPNGNRAAAFRPRDGSGTPAYYTYDDPVTAGGDHEQGARPFRPSRYAPAGAQPPRHVVDPAPAPPGQRAGGLAHHGPAVHAPALPLVRPWGSAGGRRRGRGARSLSRSRQPPGQIPPGAGRRLLSRLAPG